MAVSDETKDLLENVRKGKPRKFVMLTKGANIVSLVLFKKGSISAFIKEAKESGTGIACHGTAAGKGPDIRFQLATDDGFDKPPLKDVVLKKFLEEEADFKCKPWFEIVETLEPMLDPTDPLHARFVKLKEAVVRAGLADASKAKDLQSRYKAIGKLLEEDQRDPATVEMNALEKLLPTSGTTEVPTASTADKAEATYWALRDKLDDAVKKAAASGESKAEAIVKLFNYAEAQANFGGFANANKALASVADALKKLGSDNPTTGTKTTTTTTETPGPSTSSDSGGTTGDKPPVPPPQPPPSSAKTTTERPRGGSGREFYQLWSVARQGWVTASQQVDDQLAALGSKLKANGDADYKDIAEHGLTRITGDLKTPLQAALIGVDGATGTARGKAVEKARKAVEAFRKHIDTDERVAVCDENPFDVPVSIRTTLGAALGKLDEALAVGA